MQSSSVGTRWSSTSSTLVLMAYTDNRLPGYRSTFINSVRRYQFLGFVNALLAVATLAAIDLSPQTGGNVAVYIHREVLAIAVIAATVAVFNRAARPAREAQSFDIAQPSATPADPPGDNAHRLGGLAEKQGPACQMRRGLLWPYSHAITSGLRQIFAFSWIFATARNLTMDLPMSGGKGHQGLMNVLEAKSGYPSNSSLVLELAQCR